MQFTDSVIGHIYSAIGAVPPEQGGALLGFPESNWVTSFIHDADASTGHAVYHNSRWLIGEIERREQTGPERFMGIVHSHPAMMPHPSGQDLSEYRTTLQQNQRMLAYVAPIITHDVTQPLAEHEFAVMQARYSVFLAVRSDDGSVILLRDRPQVQPLQRILAEAGLSGPSPVAVMVDGQAHLAGSYYVPGVGPCTLLIPHGFPSSPPLIMRDADDAPVGVEWDLRLPAENRLNEVVRALAKGSSSLPREADDLSGQPAIATLNEHASSETQPSVDEPPRAKARRCRLRLPFGQVADTDPKESSGALGDEPEPSSQHGAGVLTPHEDS